MPPAPLPVAADVVEARVQFGDSFAGMRGFCGGERVLDRAQFGIAVEHIVDGRGVQRRRFLGNRGDAPGRRHFAVAALGMQFAAQQGEHAGFSAAVGAGQADAPAGVDLQAGVGDQFARAAEQGEIAKLDHGAGRPGRSVTDLILVDAARLHNSPRFRRDDTGIYAQIVYASKSTDVTDVMVNGRWLMRDRQLTTLKEDDLLSNASEYARRIDAFHIEREQSVLSKLIAIGGASETVSCEVQAKVRILDPTPVLQAVQLPEMEILHRRHYHEYDPYFGFDDPSQGFLRYRGDEFLDEKGNVAKVRYRLTLLGPAREHHYPSDVLLSRSRFIAPASHSLRFYREYFKPTKETFIQKDRLRWRVLFRGTEFYINLDKVEDPDLGYFVEVKSRTWSQRDAEHKAELADELLGFLGVAPDGTVPQDYIEIVNSI